MILPLSYGESKNFETLGSGSLSYKEIIKPKQSILFVWTTWCPYCREQIERLTQKCSFFDNIEVIYVNVGEKRAEVKKFADKMGFQTCVRNKIILDEDGYLAKKFSVYALPTFVFLKNGKLKHTSYFLNDDLLKSIFD